MTPRDTRRALLLDVGTAAAVAVVGVVAAHASADGAPRPAALAVLVAGAATLVVRRLRPVTVLVATCASVVAFTWLEGPSTAGASVLVATYTAVAAGHPWVAVAVIAAGLSAASAHTIGAGHSWPTAVADTFVLKGWLLASGILGQVVQTQRHLAEAAEERARAAERAQAEAARRRAGEERVRIARDLHDSLTHAIAVITVQAKVAVHLARKRGDEVPPALLAIEEASAQAARELRVTLQALRDDAPPRVTSLAELPRLVASAERSGVQVRLRVDGDPAAVPAEVDAAAYRVVQEALTNVARHAAPATATVRVARTSAALTVEVDDDGAGSGARAAGTDGAARTVAAGAGVGLVGMRERVDALGGAVEAGPRPDGGFRVRAVIPLVPAAAGRPDLEPPVPVP